MTFSEFVAHKQTIKFLEHLDTLSESEARKVLDSLDEDTLQAIETVLNELDLKGMARKVLPYVAAAGLGAAGIGAMSGGTPQDDARASGRDLIKAARETHQGMADKAYKIEAQRKREMAERIAKRNK